MHPDILHKGVLTGSVQLVIGLLEACAKINKQDWNGETALHLAIGNGYADIAIELDIRGADLHIIDKGDWSPMGRAWDSRNKEIRAYFLRK